MPNPEFTTSVVVRHLPEQTDREAGQYAFSYTITIRNSGDTTGQLIARHWVIADSSGHPSEPSARMSGASPSNEDVRPVTICDNVWIGRRAIILPGVTIGEGSVIGSGAVVMSDIPPLTIAMGNPARKVSRT